MSVDRPLLLVLDDVPEELDDIRRALEGRGYEIIGARDPATILRRLRTREVSDPRTGLMRWELTANVPALAVLDYEMLAAPDRSASVEDLLRFLFHYHRECTVLVYSSRLSSTDVQDRVARAHPLAHMQRKRESTAVLVARVEAMVGVVRGDLEIRGGRLLLRDAADPAVIRRTFSHHVRYRLVEQSPAPVQLSGRREAKVARAFKAELERLGSMMTVRTLRNYRYQLIERAGAAPDEADDGAE